MIKKLSYFIFIFFSIAYISSCSINNEREIKSVEELSIKVKLLQSTFESVNMDEVKFAKDTYKINMDNISKYHESDTIDYEFSHTLNLYKGIKKTGKNLHENHTTNKKNVELLLTQLGKLKLDIEGNAIQTDSIQAFIDFETKNITKLSDDIGTFVTNCEYILETHKAYAEKVRGYTVAFN
jgi:hypothetical protein|tara:strand:+ start:627 stop:1169 length:543 start_codon:yes stop_codon:yes gene_type:complete